MFDALRKHELGTPGRKSPQRARAPDGSRQILINTDVTAPYKTLSSQHSRLALGTLLTLS